MLKNYLLTALRNLRRNRAYTFITVSGLAVGMACCFLIVLFVRDELSYDRFHTKADRIYRIVSDWGDFSVPATNPPFVARFKAAHPDITVAELQPFQALVRYGDRVFKETRLFVANPQVFDVFTLRLLRGDPNTALERPYTAVITPEMARRYFGTENPIGKKLTVDAFAKFEVEITGVIEPMPENSHFHYDLLGSWATVDALFDYSNSLEWGHNSINTYLLLPHGLDPETLDAQFPSFIEKVAGKDWNGARLYLQPLTDIHLRSHLNAEIEPNSNVSYVYIFSIVAAFILLIACVNFMNLATARSEERAKEVGVRKVVGAQRKQLVLQFLTESTLLSVLALLLAVALVNLSLPAFRSLTGKLMPAETLVSGSVIALFGTVTLLVGIISGSYPAFFLSAFGPVSVLRGVVKRGSRGALLRKGLVVFQFVTSICLIVGTIVVFRQLHFLQTASVGFDKEQIVTIPIESPVELDQYAALKQNLLQQPAIASVTISSESLPSELLDGDVISFEGTPKEKYVASRTVAVGHDFFETLGVEMVAGRSFSLQHPSDSSGFIVNETAYELLNANLPHPFASTDEAIGHAIRFQGRTGPLLGVSKDFNMSALHEAIEPITFFFSRPRYDYFLLRTQPGNVEQSIASVQKVWQQINPDYPLEFTFADRGFDAEYRAEERMGDIFTVFSTIAILIACLGLFGLAAYTAERRRKEIGVRKVLGATTPSIVVLLSKEFARLVLIALVIAAPIAYLVMSRWLEDFPYRIGVGPGIILLSGAIAFAIALTTISYQAIKTALADPVKSLRYE